MNINSEQDNQTNSYQHDSDNSANHCVTIRCSVIQYSDTHTSAHSMFCICHYYL